MFWGISTTDTPCGGEIASRNALRTSTSMVRQSTVRLVYFENDRQISAPYASWNEPMPSSVLGCWPERQTTALCVIPARARPVMALVSPHPAVTQHTPARPLARAQPSAA